MQNGWYNGDQVVSDPTANRPGGRVFRIDRECYVVYVGSDDHRVRPFLRVGTSPSLPDRIRPYVGTVVLSDRLTGNPLDEATTLGSSTRRRPDYTGSPDVVHAYSPLTGMPTVEERPISSRGRAPKEGAFVQFLTDGDLNLTVNGRRIYGLDERERSDSHRSYLLERAAAIVGETAAAYRREIFARPGFLLGTDRSFFRFSGSNLTAHALRPGALEALTGRLIDPTIFTRVAGPADVTELLIWLKWWLRRRLISRDGRTISLAGGEAVGGEAGSRRLAQLLDVARAAGLAVEWSSPQGAPVPPGPAIGETPVTPREGGGDAGAAVPEILLPEGFRWYGDSAPVIIPGVPYRFHDSPRAIEEEGLLADPTEFDLERADGYGTLLKLLSRFNESGVPAGDGDAFLREVSRLLATCPAPITVEIVPTDHEYRPRFMVQRDFTLARSRENTRAVRRIGEILAKGDEESFYRDERRRLMDLLDELLRESRATTKHVPPEDAGEPAAAGDAGKAGDSRPPSPDQSQPTAPPKGSADGSAADRAPAQTGQPGSSPSDARKSSAASGGSSESGASRRAGPGTSGGRNAAGNLSARTGRSGGAGRSGRRRAGLLAAAAVVGVLLLLLLLRPSRTERGIADPAVSDEVPSVVTTEGGMDPGADSDGSESPGSNAGDGGIGDGGVATGDGNGDGASDSDEATDADAATDPVRSTPDADGEDSTPVAERDLPDDEATSIGTATTDDATTTGPAATTDDATPGTTGDGPATTVEVRGTDPIVISLSDMIRLVNRIARINGYAPLGNVFPGSRDPDWIFPGNVLELPDGSLYTIRDGDTMWGIADRFIQQSVPQERDTLIEVERRILWGEIPSRSVEVREQLEVLAEDALLESTRRTAEELMEE
jgi:hypothetical protein